MLRQTDSDLDRARVMVRQRLHDEYERLEAKIGPRRVGEIRELIKYALDTERLWSRSCALQEASIQERLTEDEDGHEHAVN